MSQGRAAQSTPIGVGARAECWHQRSTRFPDTHPNRIFFPIRPRLNSLIGSTGNLARRVDGFLGLPSTEAVSRKPISKVSLYFTLLAGKRSLVCEDFTHRQQVLDTTGVFVSEECLALTSGNRGTIWRGFDVSSSGDGKFCVNKRDAFAPVSNGQFDWWS